MRTNIASLVPVSLGAGIVALTACLVGCEVHDNTINIPNATLNVSTDVDAQNVQPMQTVAMMVDVKNVYLVDPASTPPIDHVVDAGHLEFHLDDEAAPALLVTAMTNVMVTIPQSTPPGHHKIICRVHKHDGTPTDTKFDLSINIKASVTTDGDGGVSVDATVTIEAGVSTSDAAAPTN